MLVLTLFKVHYLVIGPVKQEVQIPMPDGCQQEWYVVECVLYHNPIFKQNKEL